MTGKPREDLDRRLAGPEFFDCERLAARISARQCLLNQGKADGLRKFGTRFMGKEARCLDCPEGRGMVAYPAPPPSPEPKSPLTPLYKGGEGEKEKDQEKEGVQAGTPAPLTPAPTKRLPAWLKNASAAVRRDYLKERGL
jgi:hypothetical protein